VSTFNGRVAIVQRVLPRYRAEFFDMLAARCEGGLGVFAGEARQSEQIPIAEKLEVAQWTRAENQHLFSGPFYLCIQRNLIEWLNDWEPDILIVEANPRYVNTPAAIDIMKNRFRPVIGWGLGSPKPRGLFANLRTAWRRRFVRQFDGIIAYSQRGAAEYREMGLAANKVFVAPNAVVARITAKPPQQANKPANQPTVLYVGRLQKRKRIESLLRACASLPNDLQPKVQIVGDGPIRDELQRISSQLYLKAEFLGSRFGKELDQIFDDADLFVLPGTGGLAIQQAMSHGLPIIVAEGDGSQEDLVTVDNGWLIPANDERALKLTLSVAISDIDRLRKMGKQSFQLVQTKFNLENMVKSFVDAMNTVSA
jgi:glycosyltransferase involved in cell wall biosynthesis